MGPPFLWPSWVNCVKRTTRGVPAVLKNEIQRTNPTTRTAAPLRIGSHSLNSLLGFAGVSIGLLIGSSLTRARSVSTRTLSFVAEEAVMRGEGATVAARLERPLLDGSTATGATNR